MSQSEDIEAIHRYMVSTPLKTSDAAKVRDAWIRWYEGLSWWEKSMDGAIYDEARNRRNEFNRENAENADEKAAAERAIKNGLTTEEMAGGTTRRLSTGGYDTPLISTKTKIGWGVLAGVLLAGYAAKKLVLDRALIFDFKR